MAVDVQTEPSFVSGNPKELFRGYYASRGGLSGCTYDIAPDGQRFLVIKESDSSVDFIQLLAVTDVKS